MSPEARDHSFDELARGLASGSISRGRALRLMGAALVGGALASVGMHEAFADPIGCKRNGKACKKGTQCCSGNCGEGGTCACKPYSSACTNNSECCSGFCNQFGVCDQNVVACECEDGFINPGLCTMAACGDTTAQDRLCNSFCVSAGRGSGVLSECFLGGCGN
jgi:hypothetical protein